MYESSPNNKVCKEVSEMTSVLKREVKDKRKKELESTAALYKNMNRKILHSNICVYHYYPTVPTGIIHLIQGVVSSIT